MREYITLDEMITRKVVPHGNGAHVIVPKNWIGVNIDCNVNGYSSECWICGGMCDMKGAEPRETWIHEDKLNSDHMPYPKSEWSKEEAEADVSWHFKSWGSGGCLNKKDMKKIFGTQTVE